MEKKREEFIKAFNMGRSYSGMPFGFNKSVNWKYKNAEEALKHNMIYSLACKKIAQAKEKCISNYCRNSAGTLWESLWKYEDGKIMQKTCCSGLFNDWRTFDNEDEALESMIDELKVIERVRADG